MITEFCVICGTKDNLHVHHIVCKNGMLKPISGDYEHPTNLITLCTDHHGWIHGLKPNAFNNWKNLTKIGIKRAKAEGKYKGRKPTARAMGEQIEKLHQEGKKPSVIAKELGIGVASVYRYRV